MSRAKSLYQHCVEDFMAKAGQEVPESPLTPDVEIRRLRAALILEEAFETVRALGFEPSMRRDHPGAVSTVELHAVHEPDLIEIVVGCCDTIVVALGALSACGVADFGPMNAVLASNDSKFIDGHRREDGKWVKGPSYKPVDIEAELERQVAAVVPRTT
jgi:predicted HAD superfamily Cof-like phosphohydrolase